MRAILSFSCYHQLRKPPHRNVTRQNKKGRRRPSRCHFMSPHRLLLRWIHGRRSGCIRAAGAWGIRRRTHPASAHARLRHFLPLVELLRREQGFHLRFHRVLDDFHLGPAVFRGQAGKVRVLSQFAHFLHPVLQDGPEFWLLVIGQVELLGDHFEIRPASHARSAGRTRRAPGRRSTCRWWWGWSIGGILCVERKAPEQHIAGDKRGDDPWFRDFHKLCFGRCLQTPSHQSETVVCFVRRTGCRKVTTCAILSPRHQQSFECLPPCARWK